MSDREASDERDAARRQAAQGVGDDPDRPHDDAPRPEPSAGAAWPSGWQDGKAPAEGDAKGGPGTPGGWNDAPGSGTPEAHGAAADSDAPARPRSLIDRLLRPKRRSRPARRPRPHPFADEASTERELKADPRRVTLVWFGVSTILVAFGFWMQTRYGYVNNAATQVGWWEPATQVPLFLGLALLGLAYFDRRPWTHGAVLAGWVLFGTYWALSARDLFIREESDYVNSTFAFVGVYLCTYLAYHEWLNIARGVRNGATRFLAVAVFIAAGTYFVIAKITPARVWLIETVGHHTNWMLDLFGKGSALGLQFVIDKVDVLGPVTFFYPDTYCNASRLDEVGAWCRDNGYDYVETYPAPAGNWFEEILLYSPESDLRIIPVSIILACTAIQSIMLFVGLFFGTRAPLAKKVRFSLAIGTIVYVLNLMRNTLVIWAYGRGHMSFFVVHNIVAKALSLTALVVIAFVSFKRFPEFFESLGSVLDLPHRDGPIERTLRLGRRRPEGIRAALPE